MEQKWVESQVILYEFLCLQFFDLIFWFDSGKIKVAVDGGANHLPTIQCAKPDIVSGDFDSIKDELLQQYKQHDNIEIIHTPDQDETDFIKSILILQEKKVNFEFIIAFWSSAGRIDQIFSGINTLIRFHDKPVFLLYPGKSLSWILDKVIIKLHN